MKNQKKNIKIIENMLNEFSTEDFEQIKLLIKNKTNENRNALKLALAEGNVKRIDYLMDKVSFDDDYLKQIRKEVFPDIKSLLYFAKKDFNEGFTISDTEVLYGYYLLFKDKLELGNIKDFYQNVHREKTKFPLSDVLFCSLFNRLKLDFEYYGKNSYPKYVFIKTLLSKDKEAFMRIIDNFCSNGLLGLKFKENKLLIDELIKLGFENKLFEKTKDKENYLCLKELIGKREVINNKFMLLGLSSYNLNMIKDAFEHGIPFFKSSNVREENTKYKDAFSHIFFSKETLDIQEYIIDNIDDISWGNHIIFKTISSKIESDTINDRHIVLINKVVEKYKNVENEKIIEIESILKKRRDSYAKELFEKFLKYRSLNNELRYKNVGTQKNKI